jgi:lysophospholipase L1-like esterase
VAEQLQPPSSPPAGQRQWWHRVLRALLLLAVLGLAVEVAFRLFMGIQLGPRAMLYGTPLFRQEISVAKQRDAEWRGERTAASKRDVRAGYSKYFPHEVKTDVNDKGERLSYELNSNGFRGGNYEIAKAPGVIRIVTLGASSTFGLGSRDNETYPSLLQDRLNSQCQSGLKYEVINLGIPHLNSQMIRELYIAEALPLAPDIVTFYEGYNDTASVPGALSVENIRNAARSGGFIAEVYRTLIPIYRNIREWSMALLLIDNAVQGSQRSTPEQVAAYRSEARVNEFLSNLRAIRDEARKHGSKFIVISQQSKSYLIPREAIHGVTFAQEQRQIEQKLAAEGTITLQELFFLAHTDLMEGLRNWARTEQVPLVDGLALLDDRRDLLFTWVHLTPEGNAVIAMALAEQILRETCHQRSGS